MLAVFPPVLDMGQACPNVANGTPTSATQTLERKMVVQSKHFFSLVEAFPQSFFPRGVSFLSVHVSQNVHVLRYIVQISFECC